MWYAVTFAWAPFGRGLGPIAVSIAGIVVFLTRRQTETFTGIHYSNNIPAKIDDAEHIVGRTGNWRLS